MARKPDAHELHENLGRVRRAAAGCVDIEPRHDLKKKDSFGVTNKEKLQALIRTRYADGTEVSKHANANCRYEVDEKLMEAYGRQFDDVTEYIRQALTKGAKDAQGNPTSLKSPQQIAKGLNPPNPYFVIEWRIKTVNRDPVPGACGCGCGCGCGG